MAVVNIEVGDDGKVVGDLPDALKAHITSQIDTTLKTKEKELSDKAFNEGFQKGNARKAEELKPHLADPAERERLKTLEQENEKLKIAELERDKKYEEANQIREKRHAQELAEQRDAVTLREGKLRDAIKADIRVAAMKFGAHDTGLDVIANQLAGEIDFDKALNPFVKGADGQAAVDAKGQPLTVEGRVRQFLDANRYFVKGPGGAGGGAPGGASYAHLSDAQADAQAKLDEAQKAFDADPRSNERLLDLHAASTALAKAKQKKD